MDGGVEIREADTRLAQEIVITKYLTSTPMGGLEKEFMQCEIDPFLSLAIGLHESKLGNSYAQWFNEQYHNPFGIMANGSLRKFSCWEEAINYECGLLERYVKEKNAIAISLIGVTYAEDPGWWIKVGKTYLDLWDELESL